MTIDPGSMDRLIRIEYPVVSKNAYGEETTTYLTFADVWAKKVDKSGMEDSEGAQIVATGRTIWTIYYISGMHERMRIWYNAEVYEITAPVKEIEYKAYLEIVTEKKDNANQ